MSEVVLIHSPVDFYNKEFVNADQSSSPPMGLLYIAAYLEKKGISVRLVDPFPERLSLEEVLKIIKQEKPMVVGISSMTPAIRVARLMAQAIRNKFGKRPLIGIGGFHPSVDPNFVRRYPVFDFQVIGEGEITFWEIVKSIMAGKRPKKIYLGQMIKNLDELPFPARHLLRGDYFCPHDERKSRYPEATIISSRGCPFRCVFCSKPAHRNLYRFRSPKNIVDEMESIRDQCGGEYNFVDDTMAADKQKAIAFCEEVVSRGLKVRFATSIRAVDIDSLLIKKLGQAGCREIFIGVESGNERIRNQIINKPAPEEKLHLVVDLCRRYGIQSNFYLMLGFPTETWKEIEDTMNIGVRTKVDFIGVHITQIIPGSRLYNIALQEGQIQKDTLDKYIRGELGADFFEVFPKYVPDGLTLEDLKRARTLTYRKFFLNPGWIYRRFVSYFRYPERLARDWRLFGLGLYVLMHGHTKSAPS